MNCITSRFDIGKSLDPVNEFWVKNDVRAAGLDDPVYRTGSGVPISSSMRERQSLRRAADS
jgi:hypothetical protein